MTGRRVVASVCACAAVVSGCSATLDIGNVPKYAPDCAAVADEDPQQLSGPIVISAQSVPSASRIPCLRPLPAGWTFRDMRARSGETRIALDYGKGNDNAATITLTRSCDVGDATPSVHDMNRDVRRFDHTDQQDAHGYAGARYFVFAGGCVIERFDIRGGAARDAVATISRSIGLIERADVQQYVRNYGNDQIELDPSPGR